MVDSLTGLTLIQARAEIGAGRVSPLELTEAYLARIEALNSKTNAYLQVAVESALSQARAATEAIALRRPLGVLHGIPMALKDLIDVRGMRTTAGSVLLKDNIASQDAFVTQKIRQAGAIILGKLNLHEWALGVTTKNPHFGPCRNPWDLGRIPGGSSGGSGAALAARMCLGSIGTDTGGSIRIPASLCGIVGLKPTYGRVSLSGIVPLSWSQDHAGPMARTVEDAALLLTVIAGYDANDPSSVKAGDEDFASTLRPVRHPLKLKVGCPDNSMLTGLDPETGAAVQAAMTKLASLGCELREVSLEGYEVAIESSAKMLLAEAAAFHLERIRDHPNEIGVDVLERLRRGMEVAGVDYALARRTQIQWQRKMARLFETVDLMVLPATPLPATPISDSDSVPMATSVLTRFMRLFNMTGVPALVLPCGFTALGLPVGLQIVGPSWGETKVLQLAHLYEGATKWHTRQPVLRESK